jgi:cytochrome P450
MEVLEFDPFTAPFVDDPYPQSADHVRRPPVFYAEDLAYWVVSRYEDCRRVLRDDGTFSASNALAPVTPPCEAARTALAEGGFRSIPTITNVDPPSHTRTRRIAQAAFTPRRVAAMADVVRGLVGDYLDAIASPGGRTSSPS